MMTEENKFNWRKTFEKIFQVAGEIGILGIIAYLTENNLYLALIPVLHGLIDWMRHTEKEVYKA